MAKVYKIHPSIGIARLGTSDEIFLGPELPGTFAKPATGSYRDAAGALKRQGARFWVFEHDDTTGDSKPVFIDPANVVKIDWRVHLKNKKAIWFEFAGIVGEAPTGYPPGHPLRNRTVTVDREKKLIIDPRERTIVADGVAKTHEISQGTSSDPAKETWPGSLNSGDKQINRLGTLFVDAEGRLTVAGGLGVSGTTGTLPGDGQLNFDNNDEWFDDISDGSVSARITFKDQTTADVVPAWVTVAPPDYAPPIQNLVTVHDVLYDLALRKLNLDTSIFNTTSGGFQATLLPSFTEHIYPILKRALEYRWVIQEADIHTTGIGGVAKFDIATLAKLPTATETPDTNPRDKVFARLRNPDNLNAGGRRTMPKLHNDGVDGAPPQTNRFSVTRFQFFAMKQWAAGKFKEDWPGQEPVPGTKVTATGLDRAMLESAAGGAFFPGMEMGWILRDAALFLKPFEYRFRVLTVEGPTGLTPGDASKNMALPWQADFLKCGSNWWPAQRPNQVFVGTTRDEWDRNVQSHVHLTDVWAKLGILAVDPADPTRYVETERKPF